jgi:acyl carrier protein
MRAEIEHHVARREEVLDEVRRLLIDKLRIARQPDEIDPDTLLFGSGLGLDSVDAVELMVCLAADFGVELTDTTEVRAETRTVNALVDLILARRETAHVHA